jgi:hypothetical protein
VVSKREREIIAKKMRANETEKKTEINAVEE